MNQLTDIMRNHNIDLKTIEPGRRRNYNTYLAMLYMVEVNTSYKSLVNFLNDVEKSNRLVTVDKFELSSQVKQVQAMAKNGLTDKRPMMLEMSNVDPLSSRNKPKGHKRYVATLKRSVGHPAHPAGGDDGVDGMAELEDFRTH